MEKASHRLSLHGSASVLLKKIHVERLFFIQLAAARGLTGDEDGVTRMLQKKSGATVEVQNKMNAKNPGMVVKGNGTEAELCLLEKTIQLINRQAEHDQKTQRTLRVRHEISPVRKLVAHALVS